MGDPREKKHLTSASLFHVPQTPSHDEQLRALKISGLNHLAMGGSTKQDVMNVTAERGLVWYE